MATCNSVCAVCDLRQQTSTSTHWCIECEDPLCSDCREHHNVLNATRYHQTILISDHQSLPTVETDINQICVDHYEIYQFYCSKHESPICNKCVKDHMKCGQILSLDKIVKDIKSSESFVDLEQSLDDLSTYIKKIRKDEKSYIKSITEQKKKLSAQVCLLKQQVIQHVNKLEEEFIKELDQIEFDACNPIRSMLFLLQNKEKVIIQTKSEIKNTKKYASNLQAFLSMRKIQKKTTKYEKHIQSSIENNHHKKINLESVINTKILDILMIDTFGSIKITKSPSTDINLNRRKDRQAQMMIPKRKVLITDIKLVVQRELKTTCKYLNGCCVTKSGIILFTNNYRTLNAVNAEGKFENVFHLKYDAFDVADLGDLTVALSTGYSPRPVILIVKLNATCRMENVFDLPGIDLPGIAFGITYDGNSLICCVKDKELHVISFIDYRVSTIPNTVSRQYSYVSTNGDKIFLTNPDESKVTCCLYSGFLVWEFTDKSILKGPRGITIDNMGNVFVVGRESCNVVVISPDGKLCKQILAKEDGLDRPTAIFFDKVRKQLLVTNEKQFAIVYNVSYV